VTRDYGRQLELGLLLDVICREIGDDSQVARATQRAMLSDDPNDFSTACSAFDSLPGQARRRVADKAEDRARVIAANRRKVQYVEPLPPGLTPAAKAKIRTLRALLGTQ